MGKLNYIKGPKTASLADLTALKNKVDNLANIAAKTNIENNFTTNQTINGYIKNSNGFYKEANLLTALTIKNQREKSIDNWFIQDSVGFRNYCNVNFKHKFGNQADSAGILLFQMSFHNANEGVFLLCENNKMEFINKTVCKKLVLQELKDIVAASSDFNDFKTRMSNW